jgi:tRNA (guanosine-2'-O-)-methyltransferase
MGGGGRLYEASVKEPPSADELLLAPRKERIAKVVGLRTRTLTVVLDRLEDTFNMAAVLRTCEGMGLQDVHVIENPDVRFEPHGKVTQGCEKWLDVHLHKTETACFTQLKKDGFFVCVSAATEGAVPLWEVRFDRKIALVFGNERSGVSEETLRHADGPFWIPMRGFTQSFNISAAVAASVSRGVFWRSEQGVPQGDLTADEAERLIQRFFRLSVKQRGRIYGKNSLLRPK